jgi:4-amino-4-deoxy-L-arabinose transferase-like glycosyltransferase
MPVAILILALAAYIYAVAALPRFRLPGLALGALAAAGLTWYLLAVPGEREAARERIGPDELGLDLLALNDTPQGATLSGRVENRSPTARLREMTLRVDLYDCPPDAEAVTGCPVIAESEALARVDVPPGQLRGFSAAFVFPNRPPLTGVLRWSFEVTGTRATE